ncbi:replication initiation factor domain-containing protein [Streptococcus merionis]|uniref:replication initiation factor domain-containing protein n=1 Tax=Streptococcus merionis TaxID=400065 RepID=UPI003515FF73
MFNETELKRIRRYLGFSLKEFAKLLSVNPNTYKKMESGERPVTLEVQQQFNTFIASKSKLSSSKLEGKIDYLRIRFRTMDYKTIIDKVLQLADKPFVRENGGRYSYTGYVRFGEINVYYSKEDYSMGTLVEFSGQGCRFFEWYMINEQGRDWEQFLLSCFTYAGKFSETEDQLDDFLKITRIDIALDEMYHSSGNYDLFKLKRKVDLGLVKRKSKEYKYVDGSSGEESKGKSLYFGSKNSPVVLNFYEKDLEQAGKLDVPVDFIHSEYGFKNRYEVRLLGQHAHKFVKKWLYEFDGFNLADKAVALINDKLHVYKKSSNGFKLDEEWYALMGSYGSFTFEMVPKRYEIGVKEYRWIERSVAPTLKFLFELENIRGRKKLWQMINDAVLSDGQQASLDYEREYQNEIKQQEVIDIAG